MAAPTVVRRACVTGGVRGRSCSDAAPENGASLRAPAGAPTRFPPRGGQRGNGQCARERPKLAPRRQAWVSRGRIVARRSGATRITASPTERAEVGGVAVAFTSCENYPLGSRTMTRMLVSNVGCRSWREAPSSFHRGPREGAEAGAGSAARRQAHDRAGRACRAKGCRVLFRRGPSPGNTTMPTRPQGRGSSQPKALWSHARLSP